MKKLFINLFSFSVNLFSLFYLSLFITDYSFLFSRTVSNISNLTGFFVFLLVSLWFIDKGNFRKLIIFKITGYLAKLKDSQLLFILFFYIFLMFSAMGITRHMSLGTMAWDMGIFEQAFWNTLHGDLFFSSIRGNFTLMGEHFEPILFLILPFYSLKPSVETLIIIQAVILGLSVFALYLIAKEKLNSRFLVFSLITSFVLSKGLRGVGLSDFHPESLILLFSFFAFFFLIKRNNLMFILSCILLLFCKETTVFIIFGIGLYSLFFLKRRFCGLSLIFIAVAFWIIETRILLPYFSRFGGSYFYLERLPFGKTYAENFSFIVGNFPQFISFIFAPGKIDYLFRLTGSLCFLPFLAPSLYIVNFMPLVTILLASDKLSGYYSLTSHYAGAVIPFIYISAVYGVANFILFLKKRKKLTQNKSEKILGILIVLFSLIFYGKTDISKYNRYISGAILNKASEKLGYIRVVPKDVTLSATSNYVPHLCHRKYIYDWDPNNPLSLATEYLLIDLDFQGYLKEDARKKIPEFFNAASRKGYKIIFSSPDNRLFIMHNPSYDLSVIEKFQGNIGL